MLPLIAHAPGQNVIACIHGGMERPVFYCIQDSHDTLVLPQHDGFHETVLKELCDSVLGGYLGAKNTYLI